MRRATCVLVSLFALGGCVEEANVPLRPAGAMAATTSGDPRLFSPPFALAEPEDAVVRIVGAETTCTGALVRDDLVLTAHHCVVARGPGGAFLSQVVPASSLRIELGGDYLAWGTVGVRAIVAPPCGASGGGGDVAVLVLERHLVGLATLTARLDAPPRIGEPLDAVGFGRCATSNGGIRRRQRAGSPVRALTGDAVILDASVCPGDSGGPVIARGSHEVFAVVSLSAMDGDERTSAPSIMARLDVYRDVFGHAALIADGIAPGDLPPLGCAR